MDEEVACASGARAGAFSEADLEHYVAMLRALGHPVRLRMVDLIFGAGGEICVCEFEKYFDLTQPTISHHLKVLRESGIIRSRQDGTWVRHAIEPAAFEQMRELAEGFCGPEKTP